MTILRRASSMNRPGLAAALFGWRLGQLRASIRLTLLVATLALGACMQRPDLRAVELEKAKAVLRSDTFQSASSNGKVVVAGTSSGALVRSADAGRSWSRQRFASPSSVIALTTCPDGSFVGLDFYRKVWLGDAGGQQWSPRPLPSKINPMAIACAPDGRLWIAGSHTTLLSSADRGQTWAATDFDEDALLTTVQFIDDQHAVVTGEFGTVLTTADAGKTWVRQAPIPGDFYPYATVFTDRSNGWSSGLGGVIWHTADGGKTWRAQDNRAAAPMYTLLRQGDELYGLGGGGLMVVKRGDAWERFDHGLVPPAYLAAGAVLDARSMLVAGSAGALHVVTAPGQIALAAHHTQGAAR